MFKNNTPTDQINKISIRFLVNECEQLYTLIIVIINFSRCFQMNTCYENSNIRLRNLLHVVRQWKFFVSSDWVLHMVLLGSGTFDHETKKKWLQFRLFKKKRRAKTIRVLCSLKGSICWNGSNSCVRFESFAFSLVLQTLSHVFRNFSVKFVRYFQRFYKNSICLEL